MSVKVESNEPVVTRTSGLERGLSKALEGWATGRLTLRQALTGEVVMSAAIAMQTAASTMLAAGRRLSCRSGPTKTMRRADRGVRVHPLRLGPQRMITAEIGR